MNNIITDEATIKLVSYRNCLGKNNLIVEIIKDYVRRHKGKGVMIIFRYRGNWEYVWEKLHERFGEDINYYYTSERQIELNGGGTIRFGGSNDESVLRGGHYSLVIFDESLEKWMWESLYPIVNSVYGDKVVIIDNTVNSEIMVIGKSVEYKRYII